MTWTIEHTSPLDVDYIKYLKQNNSDMIMIYPSLSNGLLDLNGNKKLDPFVFIASDYADRIYLCLNCEDKYYKFMLNNMRQIMNNIMMKDKLNTYRNN